MEGEVVEFCWTNLDIRDHFRDRKPGASCSKHR